jgi:hypothetical protein
VKGRRVQQFATRHLLPHLDGFRADGKLLYQAPVANILRGFIFDSSGFSAEAFYPHVFVQPLYVPRDNLDLTLGERFLGAWKFDPEHEQQVAQKLLYEIFRTGLPLLRRQAEPGGIVEQLRRNPALRANCRLQEVLAYSLLILGRNDEGLDELDKLLAMLEPLSEARSWERALHAEIGILREKLMRDPAELRAMLQGIAEQTRQKLRLPE